MSERDHIQYVVRRAIRRGDLVRPDACELCSKSCRPVAHHYLGYEEHHLLDVQWLCRGCHLRVHGNVTTRERYTVEQRREFRMRGLNARSPKKISADARHAALASPRRWGWEKLTPEQRSERARRANKERWRRYHEEMDKLADDARARG